ncbi:hypothetical protein KY284_020807 [Solanum tuberosum]|nr:hypothetical protein KY284_020807 [Solanum tuberosum]
MEQNQAEMSFIPPTMSNLGMDPLFNPLHLFQQGAPPPVLVPTRSMESSNQGPTNVASTSQRGNGPDFRRNFRSLCDWHKHPLVTLLETKMQNHRSLLEDFPFTRMIKVPAVGNLGGIVVLWDYAILELVEITTTTYEVHAIIKGKKPLAASGYTRSSIKPSDFQEIINHCELIDMGFKGSRYALLNKIFKNKKTLIVERLDRFLVNND